VATKEHEQSKKDDKLFEAGEMPEQPSRVRGKMILFTYLRPHYVSEKDERSVEMEFSVALADEHKGLIPKVVESEWQHLKKNSSTGIIGIEIPPQTVDIFIAPEIEKVVHLSAAFIKKASLAVVEETGAGAAVKVTRFKFRVVAEVTDANRKLRDFADLQFDKDVWLTMNQAQGTLE